MKSTEKGFTLVELMVVLGIVAMLMAAMTTTMWSAQKRAKVAKAESEVKVITQAILSYENWNPEHTLPAMQNRDADQGALGFLIGDGGSSESGDRIPSLLMAQLTSGGKMTDPWNTPYRVSIKEGTVTFTSDAASGTLRTGYYYPNYYRLSAEERQ